MELYNVFLCTLIDEVVCRKKNNSLSRDLHSDEFLNDRFFDVFGFIIK
jgi:hypothetical protein